MRTWFEKEAYLIGREDGVIVVRSSGADYQKINNVQFTVDHLNNLSVAYDNFNWRFIDKYNDIRIDVGWGITEPDENTPPLSAYPYFSDVLPEYIDELEYTYTKGWWRKKTFTKKYCITKLGWVRLKIRPAHHIIQGNRWLIESKSGEVTSNFNDK